MTFHIPPEFEEYAKRAIAAGEYQSTAELLYVALRLLEERDLVRAARAASLRADVERGIAELDAGQRVESTAELLEEIKRRGRERLAKDDHLRRSA